MHKHIARARHMLESTREIHQQQVKRHLRSAPSYDGSLEFSNLCADVYFRPPRPLPASTGLLQGARQGTPAQGAHHRPRENLQQARRAEDPGGRRSVPRVGLSVSFSDGDDRAMRNLKKFVSDACLETYFR